MRQFLTVALKDDFHVNNISSSEVDSLYLKTNKTVPSTSPEFIIYVTGHF